jgi:hypothetical protein
VAEGSLVLACITGIDQNIPSSGCDRVDMTETESNLSKWRLSRFDWQPLRFAYHGMSIFTMDSDYARLSVQSELLFILDYRSRIRDAENA